MVGKRHRNRIKSKLKTINTSSTTSDSNLNLKSNSNLNSNSNSNSESESDLELESESVNTGLKRLSRLKSEKSLSVSEIIKNNGEIDFTIPAERNIVSKIHNLQSSLDELKDDYDGKAMGPRLFKSLKIMMLINHLEFKGGDDVLTAVANNIAENSIETSNFAIQFDKLQNDPSSIDNFFKYLESMTPENIKKSKLNTIVSLNINKVNNDIVNDKLITEKNNGSEIPLINQKKIEKISTIQKKNNKNEVNNVNEDDEEILNLNDNLNDNDNENCNSDEFGEEYSFDLELSNTFYDPYKFHVALFKLLRITIPSENQTHAESNIYDLFLSLATLCDPYTQPSSTGDHNEMILSADLISDLMIAIHYSDYIDVNIKGEIFNLPKFDFAYDIAKIIEKIMIILNADNEENLMIIRNDDDNWEEDLPKWLPHNAFSNIVNIASDFHHMMLLYTIATVGLLIISKLYKDVGNICLNPFLSLYLQLWKNSTRIIYLGIEIDRRDEENGFPGYPEVIRYMIKGSSAMRSMISLILNDDFEKRLHDLKHESLINFMRPWGRKYTNGSITRDIRVFVAALLALGSELDSVTELLFNFDPEDRYDEDIRYMFDMELDDMENLSNENNEKNEEDNNDQYHTHHKESTKKKFIGGNGFLEIERHDEEINNDYENNIIDSEKDFSTIYDLHPDCKCEFEDFDSEFDDDEDEAIGYNESGEEKAKHIKQLDNEEFINHLEKLIQSKQIDVKDLDMETMQKLHLEAIQSINNAPSAIRSISNKKSELDSKGRDWNDIPRGENQILTNDFVKLLKKSVTDSTIFLTPIDNLLNSLKLMIKQTLDSTTCEKIIRSVAWVVQYEHESKLMSDEEANLNNDPNINADVVYNFLKTDDNFVKMMNFNPSSAFFIIDELLMADGYRRVLIWFLTHLPLNQWLITYFHDLLIGQRGNPEENENIPKSTRFGFSRKGALVLSEVEQSMLLHEFLSNAVIYLSRGSSYELEDILENNQMAKNHSVEDDVSSFITNRSNAQKLIKVICLMLKSLETHNIIDTNDSEYRVEIQTLLVQWVGVGFVPEARELFFKYSNNPANSKNITNEKKADSMENLLVVNSNDSVSSVFIKESKDSDENSKEKKEYYQLLVRLHNSKFYKLTSSLESFSSFDLFILTINMAHHYRTEKETCFEFVRGLNAMYHIYEDEENLIKDFEEFFSALNDAIVRGDDEKVIEIMHASRFLSNDTIIQARRTMKKIADDKAEEDNVIDKDGNPSDLSTLQLLRKFPLKDCIKLEKQKKKSGTFPSVIFTEAKDANHSVSNNNSRKNKKKTKHRKHK